MTDDQLIQLAVAEGFSAAAVVDTKDIPIDPAFRPYCEENLCGKYGVNYACPPDCGSVEEMTQRILSHKKALMVQTIWEISDYTDSKAIKEAKGGHNSAMLRLIRQAREQGHTGFMVGASGCSLCDPCAIVEGKPCKLPDYRFSCMSAYCVFVKALADKCGIEYNCGDGLLAFFGMFVYD